MDPLIPFILEIVQEVKLWKYLYLNKINRYEPCLPFFKKKKKVSGFTFIYSLKSHTKFAEF